MEPARADPEGRVDELKSKGTESTLPTQTTRSPTKTGKRKKLSMDVGKKEVAVRRTPSVASSASRRGSISMLAYQLRTLESQKEGEVRCVAAFPAFSCADLPLFMFSLVGNVRKTQRTAMVYIGPT